MMPSSGSSNLADMERITAIVNRVYAASEASFWKNGASRTTVQEIKEFTSCGEIAVARIKGEIVGCVRVQQLDAETGEFGMLAVDEKYHGLGFGRELIRFAEQKCQKEHLHKMQLELLVPKVGTHPDKVFLENWYTRIGYHPVQTEPVDALIPELAQMLAIPCQFVIFQKKFR